MQPYTNYSDHLGRPAGLIVRSMLEGLAVYRWAQADQQRAYSWRAYAAVVDFRMMNRVRGEGGHVEPSTEAFISKSLERDGPLFFTDKAREALASGARLPADPYVRSWNHPLSVEAMFHGMKGKPLYEHFYRPESERSHWSVASLAKHLRRLPDGGTVNAGDTTPEEDFGVVAAAFQAALELFQDVDSHLRLGHAARLSTIQKRFVAAMTPGLPQ